MLGRCVWESGGARGKKAEVYATREGNICQQNEVQMRGEVKVWHANQFNVHIRV